VGGTATADLAFGTDAPLHEVMRTMRAMRRLSERPVDRQTLEALVEAATWAPTASNAQAYQWVVVTDRAQIRRLAELWNRCFDFYMGTIGQTPTETMDPDQKQRMFAAAAHQRDHFTEIPALLVACYDQRGQGRHLAKHPWAMVKGLLGVGLRHVHKLALNGRRASEITEAASVYPGVQNLLLTARAMGLGATMTTWHLTFEPDFKRVLGIPRGVKTFAIVPVGWPTGKFGPVRRRPVSEVIRWDRWGDRPEA
jgi:nitroreductase